MTATHVPPARGALAPLNLESMPNAPSPRSKFSHELQHLTQQVANRPVLISEVLATAEDKGIHLLLLLIALPFLSPITLPGLSTPFGLVIVLVGAQLALRRRPWLPKGIAHRELPAGFIARLLDTAGRIVRWLEVLLRPRLDFLHEQSICRRIAGILVMLSGLLLLLPLPIPLSNSFPALTVVLLSAGAMERDGFFFLAGCAMFVLTLTFFGLLAIGGADLLATLGHAPLRS